MVLTGCPSGELPIAKAQEVLSSGLGAAPRRLVAREAGQTYPERKRRDLIYRNHFGAAVVDLDQGKGKTGWR
jgi:hypothetical protein